MNYFGYDDDAGLVVAVAAAVVVAAAAVVVDAAVAVDDVEHIVLPSFRSGVSLIKVS